VEQNLHEGCQISLMKKVFFILSLSLIYYAGDAQSRRTAPAGGGGFSIGLEAGLPVGENAKPYSQVIGGSLQYEIKPASDMGITLNGGYLNFGLKKSYGGGSVGFVPLLAGVKYYFTPAAFFHAQLGAAVGTKTGQGTSFAYSPGLGYKLSPNIDAELKYTGISNKGGSLDNVGLRLGYNF
jgi:hypothetical protein